MGCTTSHDAFAAAVRTRARRRASSSAPPRPAALCRERAALIRAAADRRFALAAAHAAYFRSLAAVGDALRRFAAAALAPSPGSSSPVVTLPPSPAKAATVSSLPPSPSSSSTVSPLSHSLSDDDDDLLRGAGGGGGDKAAASSSSTRHHRHYMRRSPTEPDVVYEQDPNNNNYTRGDVTYGYGYGYAYPHGPFGEVVTSTPTEEIRPPSPPAAETSPWDFFDPFTSYDRFMEDYSHGNPPTTNSPNYYAELRRMEGIPELEDEAELEAHASTRPSASTPAAHHNHKNAKGKEPISDNNNAEEPSSSSSAAAAKLGSEPAPVAADDAQVVPSPSNASSTTKEEVSKGSKATFKTTVIIDAGSSSNAKKKSVAFDEEDSIRPAQGGGGDKSTVQSAVSSDSLFSPLHRGHGTRDVAEAMDEIKGQFDEAANCGAEVSRLLEVGKLPRRTTPRVLRCGPVFQSSGSCWSYRLHVVLPTKIT